MRFSVPPGYRRSQAPRRPKLEPCLGVIDQILDQDVTLPRKQRHTAWRLFERRRDKYGFDDGYTIVKDYLREKRLHRQEMFVPLPHPPGPVTAVVPLDLMGLAALRPGDELRMDVGFIFGDALGANASARAYWHNNSYTGQRGQRHSQRKPSGTAILWHGACGVMQTIRIEPFRESTIRYCPNIRRGRRTTTKKMTIHKLPFLAFSLLVCGLTGCRPAAAVPIPYTKWKSSRVVEFAGSSDRCNRLIRRRAGPRV